MLREGGIQVLYGLWERRFKLMLMFKEAMPSCLLLIGVNEALVQLHFTAGLLVPHIPLVSGMLANIYKLAC